MDGESDGEVYLANENVIPGYLYDYQTEQFHSSKLVGNIKILENPVTFSCNIWSKEHIDASSCKDVAWAKDLDKENTEEVILVNGVGCLEKKGVTTPLDNFKHTVTSIFYKYNVYMLVFLSQVVTQELLDELKKYLCSVTSGFNESFIPQFFTKNFKYAYIYPNFTAVGTKSDTAKHALQEFWHALKSSQVSPILVSAFVRAPSVSYENIAEEKLEDTTLKSSEENMTKVAITNAALSDMGNTYNKSAANTGKDDIAGVHANITPVQAVNQNTNSEPSGEKGRGHGKRQAQDESENAKAIGKGRGFGTMHGRGRNDYHETHKSGICNVNYIFGGSNMNDAHNHSESFITETGIKKSHHEHYQIVIDHDVQDTTQFLESSQSSTVANYSSESNNHSENIQEIAISEVNNSQVSKTTPENVEKNNRERSQGKDLNECEKLSQKFSQMKIHDSSILNQSDNLEKCEEANVGRSALNESSQKPTISVEEECSPNDLFRRHGKRKTDNTVQNTFEKDSTCELESVSQNDSGTSENQNKLQQGLCIDEIDDHSPLKVTQQEDLNTTKEHTHEKEKHINMISKLLNPLETVSDPCGLKRKYYGFINRTVPEKVIILLGASGSGKTTLVNFIANYFSGKKTADDELIHVETISQTSAITAYTFCSSSDDIPITVIDTPGLNDSSGAEVRDHVQSLKTFLANAASKNFEIHAIGFVAQAHLVRLTSSERLVMNYVSTMFGQSVSEHMITLVTFADNQDTPPVVEAMRNYKVNFKLFLKFNNSTLSNMETDEVEDLDRVYWKVCRRNWKKCLKALKDLPALSVNTMKAVQSEIYATTVIESAEKDLRAELKSFFILCQRESYLTKEALEVCEEIWELAAVLHRLKYARDSPLCSVQKIMIDLAKETCKALHISPDNYINLLSLAPSRSLTVSGSEIIGTMAMMHEFGKKWHRNSTSISKSITECAYCHKCCKEHKMKRCENTWLRKFIPGIVSSAEILTLKCEDCSCPGAVHGVRPDESPLSPNRVLRYTRNCLCKALGHHSLQGFAVPEERFLHHLKQHLSSEHQEFIHDLLKISSN